MVPLSLTPPIDLFSLSPTTPSSIVPPPHHHRSLQTPILDTVHHRSLQSPQTAIQSIPDSISVCCSAAPSPDSIHSNRNEWQNAEVERYSDRSKPKATIRRGSLLSILELKGFPQELTEGSRVQQPGQKKVRWNLNQGWRSWIYLKSSSSISQNGAKGKKEGEGEDEDENEEEDEPEDDDFSDDDYYKHFDFDDDEDEYNMEDDGDDEPLL